MLFKGKVCVGYAVVALIGSSVAASEVPPLLSSTFVIDKQVDDVRYVERVVYSNTFNGDWKIEFMAERTDLEDTSERWTLVLERGEEMNDSAIYAYVDGDLQYASVMTISDGQPHYTISNGEDSKTVALDGSATQSQLESVALLIDATSHITNVAEAIRVEIVEQLNLEVQPACSEDYDDCSDDCKTDHPMWDQPCEDDHTLPEDMNCVEKFVCCMQKNNYIKCVGECSCHFCDTDHDDIRDCLEEKEFFYDLVTGGCLDQLGQCLGLIPAWP